MTFAILSAWFLAGVTCTLAFRYAAGQATKRRDCAKVGGIILASMREAERKTIELRAMSGR